MPTSHIHTRTLSALTASSRRSLNRSGLTLRPLPTPLVRGGSRTCDPLADGEPRHATPRGARRLSSLRLVSEDAGPAVEEQRREIALSAHRPRPNCHPKDEQAPNHGEEGRSVLHGQSLAAEAAGGRWAGLRFLVHHPDLRSVLRPLHHGEACHVG
jgi:hypothetical protein